MTAPYFDDGQVTLFLGDCRDVLDRELIDVSSVDVVIADPPYGDTSLVWDRWPDGWVDAIAAAVPRIAPLWCFSSMRMTLTHGAEFPAAGWKFAQDVVWEKHNGSGFVADRFKRVHEHVLQWYRGPWEALYREVPRVPRTGPKVNGVATIHSRTAHTGEIGAQSYDDDGFRLTRSVIKVRSEHGRAIHPTQKPLGILEPLLRYSCPPGGLVLDPFAGSCSTLVAAREAGYRAIGIEADPEMCEKAAERLGQGALPFDRQESSS